MNRRDFLGLGVKATVAGILVPVVEPVRKVWALDRTMIRPPFADLPLQANPGPILTWDGLGGKTLEGEAFTCVTDAQGITHVYDLPPVGAWVRELHTDGFWREHVFTGMQGWVSFQKEGADRPIPEAIQRARRDPERSGTMVVVDNGRIILQDWINFDKSGGMASQ